jgi:hypothetical protein
MLDENSTEIPQCVLVNELYEKHPDKFINISDFNEALTPEKELSEEEISSLNEKELIL